MGKIESSEEAGDRVRGAPNSLPRWRGFNLLYFYTTKSEMNPLEEDFQWMAQWGFDFVRLPSCYLLWTDPKDPFRLLEPALERIDRAVELGQKYGIHISLNFHRAPGYSVNREREEPFNLWKDEVALKAFCFHWTAFAQRYRGIPSERLSFNLVNEPSQIKEGVMGRADHERVIRAAAAPIREVDPERLTMADGLVWGNEPLMELVDTGMAQSCRGYLPMGVSHYQARWVGGENFPPPRWPGERPADAPVELSSIQRHVVFDRPSMENHFGRWAALLTQVQQFGL